MKKRLLGFALAVALCMPSPAMLASEVSFGLDDFLVFAEDVRMYERANSTAPPSFNNPRSTFFQVGGNAYADTHVTYWVPRPNMTTPTQFRDLHLVSITNLRGLFAWFTDDTVTGIGELTGFDEHSLAFLDELVGEGTAKARVEQGITGRQDLQGFENDKRYMRFVFDRFFEMRGHNPASVKQFILSGNIKSFDAEDYTTGGALYEALFPVMLSDGIAHVTFMQERGAGAAWRASMVYINANFDFSIYRSSDTQPRQMPVTGMNAAPALADVFVNGRQIAFEAYSIGDSNYFKLRDIAHALSGTQRQFDVVWDASLNAVNLLSDMPYNIVGGEMLPGNGAAKNAAVTASAVFLDGSPIALNAYNIEGSNFFMLRDIGKLLNFSVEWDAAQHAIRIDTSKLYGE